MANQKLILKAEMVPYLNYFDLGKAWRDLKLQRLKLIEQAREIRAKGYNNTLEINEIEEKMSAAIVKLEKKNDKKPKEQGKGFPPLLQSSFFALVFFDYILQDTKIYILNMIIHIIVSI